MIVPGFIPGNICFSVSIEVTDRRPIRLAPSGEPLSHGSEATAGRERDHHAVVLRRFIPKQIGPAVAVEVADGSPIGLTPAGEPLSDGSEATAGGEGDHHAVVL